MSKNRLRIPCSFNLYGFTIKVEWKNELTYEVDDDCYGLADRDLGIITLQTPSSDYDVHQVEQTFLHEAVHLILEYGGYTKEDKNEKFVEHMSNLLYQMFVTSQFCDKNDRMIDYKIEK